MLNIIYVNKVPHIVIDDTMLLVYASWANNFHLLLNQKQPVASHTMESKFPFFIKGPTISDSKDDTYNTYLVGSRTASLQSTTPRGFFVSLSFQGTIYRYLNWMLDYSGLQLPNEAISALSEKAADNRKFPELPDVLSILRYDWNTSSSKPIQYTYYQGNGALFEIHEPRGYVENDKALKSNLKAIEVKGQPPHPDVIIKLIIDPTLTQLKLKK